MAKRKRTSRRSGLVGRAVSAGRRALREAESRVPPDVRRQVERRLKDADKSARAAIKTLQTQVKRASTRADVNQPDTARREHDQENGRQRAPQDCDSPDHRPKSVIGGNVDGPRHDAAPADHDTTSACPHGKQRSRDAGDAHGL
ncbi:MAG: hypothetical protein E6I96_04725 [Chloroflexi bacterium]|nr:MAG: hypothetical protein E6I96_04725 [Chloroflexota bacterium]